MLQNSAIERQLEKILSSQPFAGSERMIRFLRFIVEQTLAGKTSEIKEYTIGMAAFDRPAAFDPRSDAVVRVEARRLRSKLAEYYQSEGKTDAIRIELPKGAYVPAIQEQEPMRPVKLPVPDPATRWLGPALVIFALAIVGLLVFRAVQVAKSSRAFPAHVNSIAVLPFVDMSEKQDQEYFCEGMTEEVIHTLTQVPGLRVPARTSVYRLRNADIPEVGRQLRVETVLEGSVRKEGDHLRVTAQLIRVSDNTHLWSETYDQTTKTAFSIQQSIARAIVEKLSGQVASVHKASTEDQEAHNLYLLGRFYANKMTSVGVRQSIDYFNQAIAKDPNYAQAYAGLAESYDLAGLFNALPERSAAEARAAALKAIALDDSLGEAHVALGRDLMWHAWDWAGAERELKRAIELSPQYPEAYQVYAWYLAYRGQTDEALRTIQKAIDLDPLSARIGNVHASLLMYARQYGQALAAVRKVIDMEPDFGRAHQTMGRILALQGRYDEAIAVLRKSVEMGASGEGRLARLGWAYAVAGRREEALKILNEVTAGEHPPRMMIALIYAGLGDRDRAFEWLDRAVANHGMIVQVLEPDWDNLRPDPRYAELLKKIGVR